MRTPDDRRVSNLVIGVCFAAVIVYLSAKAFLVPTTAIHENIMVRWTPLRDRPGIVLIQVRDSAGSPLSNVNVTSESRSGRAVNSNGRVFTTDDSGVATISPGEHEIIAIWLGDQRIALRPPNRDYFHPNCDRGIVFEAIIVR